MKRILTFLLPVVVWLAAECSAWDFSVSANGENRAWTSPALPVDPNPETALLIDWTYRVSDLMWCPNRIVWYDRNGKRINAEEYCPEPRFYQPGSQLTGKVLRYRQRVPRSDIPAGAESFRLKVLGSIQHPDHPAGVAEFNFPEITWRPEIRSVQPYNWFDMTQTVEFQNPLREGGRLRGVVRDSDGNPVADLVADGPLWSWKPVRPGFYGVAFSELTADGREIPLAREILFSGTNFEKGALTLTEQVRLPVDTLHFAVTAEPPRPPDADSTLGANVLVNSGRIEQELAALRLMGVANMIRYHWFYWSEIEKTPGQYDWSKVDRILAIGERCGIPQEQVILNTFGTPRWNTTQKNPDNRPFTEGYFFYAPKEVGYWGDFLAAFSKRYPRIRTWELWNEPHLPGFSIFWQESTPKQYVELLKTGYQALKRVDPDDTVISGGIAMRYMPWYSEFLKEGGNDWCDRIGTHNGYDHSKFHEIEKLRNAKSHPFVETEWHANLFDCRSDYYPTEEELTYWMLVNLANLLTQEKERIMVFQALGRFRREVAGNKAKLGGIQQISGLFYTEPDCEPRQQAYALRVATDLFRGKVTPLGAWTFADGSQTAAVFESKAGRVMFFWVHEGNGEHPAADPGIVKAMAGRELLDWEGNPADREKLRLRRVYYVREPDVAALRGGARVTYIPTPRRTSSVPLERNYSGVHAPLSAPAWQEVTDFVPVHGEKNAEFKARFAVELNEKGIGLQAEVRDAVHHPQLAEPGSNRFWNSDSIQFAIDAGGKGDIDDVLEFEVGDGGRIVKLKGPAIGGDLPAEYSIPGKDLRNGKAQVVRQDGKTVYRIFIPAADLYPYQPSVKQALRFSLLVNNNDGRGREGYLEWGSGIGGIKAAYRYGTLYASTGRRTAGEQKDLNKGFQDADASPGAVAVVQARSDTARGGGISTPLLPVTSGGRYRISGEARGTAGPLLVMCYGPGLKRADLAKLPMSETEWRKFEGEVVIPEQTVALGVTVFVWNRPGARFEVRNFRVEGL